GFVVMDGIDGTTNASRRIPFYCCSLAYAPEFRLSAVTHAAVIDLATGDLYHATKGKGAFCNGRRIKVGQPAATGKDLVVGMSTSDTSPEVVRRLSPLMFKKIHIRQLGAIALEMCLLARGQLDACIDIRGKIRPTDIAAACLIVREAGGSVYSGASGGQEQQLDAALGVETRISLVAAAHRQAFEELLAAGVFNAQQHT
ncbi:MAG: fructose 1,6-bisphosphatase, partial [Nitrososphaera sp.]